VITKGVKFPKDSYFLRAESFYNVASNIDEIGANLSYGGKSLHEQSHGESFLSLFVHRLFGEGIYIFDEPESALSPQRQLSFLLRMHELVQQESQFIIATHSPIILSYPNAKIIQISKNGFEEVAYEETDCFKLYKDFLNNSKYMLSKLDIEKF
jgi:predicted ATPase